MPERDEPPPDSRQRVDKWLFFARMVKSRSLGQAMVEAGLVTVNGELCSQPSRMLKSGDRLDLQLESRDVTLVVRGAGDRRGPFEEARRLYDDVTPQSGNVRLTPFERAQRGLLQKKSRPF